MQAVADVPENLPAMMACEKMHARIPVKTCVGRQTKGIFIGHRGEAGYQHIPYECRDCEAGRAALAGPPPKIEEEDIMAVTKACGNCGRVKTIVAGGCCYVCWHAGKGLEGSARDEALAAVKARIERGEVKRGSGRRKQAASRVLAGPVPEVASATRVSPSGGAPGLLAAPEGERPEPSVRRQPRADVLIISIDFTDARDRALHTALIATAARLRRTPEQQILWMLGNAIEAESGLLDEACR